MQIAPHELHIWQVNLADWDAAQLIHLLNATEKKRALRYHFKKHQSRFIIARANLKKILSYYLNVVPQNIHFKYTAHQKPFLPTKTLQFNLSHADELMLCALTHTQAVGIDIEKMREIDFLSIAERFFNPAEITYLTSLPPKEQLAGFFKIWSAKEAVTKALGKGLSLTFASFSVNIAQKNSVLQLENETWFILQLDCNDHYQAAVATNYLPEKMIYWQLTPENYYRKN